MARNQRSELSRVNPSLLPIWAGWNIDRLPAVLEMMRPSLSVARRTGRNHANYDYGDAVNPDSRGSIYGRSPI